MFLKKFRPLHHNISKVTVNKVVLDSQPPCTVQHWTDLLSVCFCKSAPLLSPSLLSLIGLSQGYPEVSYCHMASQRPTDVMLLLHNLWRLLFLQMRCTINLCPAEFHGSVCLLLSRSTKTNHSLRPSTSLLDVVLKKQQKTTFSLIILIVWHQRQTGGAAASVRQQSKGLSSLAALAHTENLKWGVKQQQPQVPGQHRQQARPLPLWLTVAFWLVLMKESCIRVDPGCPARSTVEAESGVTAD